MAKIKTSRVKSALIVQVLPSLDFPGPAAICLSPEVHIRIHGTNGGYLVSLVADKDGTLKQYIDRSFMDGSASAMLAVQPFDVTEQMKAARKEMGFHD